MRDTEGFVAGQLHYRLTSLNASSSKYGPCEVCMGHVTEVFYQVEERYYVHPKTTSLHGNGWTQHETTNRFGHEECLVKRRRGEFIRSYVDSGDGRTYHLHDIPAPAQADPVSAQSVPA